MQPGDVIIDGGNTFWQDDVRRGKALKERGCIMSMSAPAAASGASKRGYCMMIGGDKAVVRTGSNRSSRRWRPALATSPRTPAARAAIAHRAGVYPCRPDRRRTFRQRWSTTASSTA